MKIILIFILVSSTIFPQSEILIFGGSNFSTIKYNNTDLNNQIDINLRNGSTFGIEYRFSKIILELALRNVDQNLNKILP